MASTTTQEHMIDAAQIEKDIANPLDEEKIPFPWKQMLVLSICRFVEPIAFCSILTYAPKMVQEIRGQENATMYSGLLISVFSGAEALTAWIWGDVSDRLGRKPCILVALAGTALSCLTLGFSKHYWLAITARIIGGCLNGNTAVMQTMVNELVRNPKHEHIAYSMAPLVWNVGSIVGSALGGWTAQPAKSWPKLENTIWNEYPYLLPNVLSTAAIIGAAIACFFFLEESNTLERRANRHQSNIFSDIYRLIKAAFSTNLAGRRASTDSTTPFLDDEKEIGEPIKAFTRPVLAWIFSLFILSYHQMAFAAQLPSFLEDAPQPTRFFSGGLGKTTGQVAVVQSVQSGISIFASAIVYPEFSKRLGTWRSGLIALALATVPYTIFPMVKNFPKPDVGVYLVIVLQCLATSASYPLILIILKNAYPSLEVAGRIMGVAMSMCSLARTFAPPLVGLLYDELGTALCWWSVALVALMGFVQLFFCKRPPGTD